MFPCKIVKTYRGDLRRRRIRAKAVQKNNELLARRIPYPRPLERVDDAAEEGRQLLARGRDQREVEAGYL